jgi:hypothetical protein
MDIPPWDGGLIGIGKLCLGEEKRKLYFRTPKQGGERIRMGVYDVFY